MTEQLSVYSKGLTRSWKEIIAIVEIVHWEQVAGEGTILAFNSIAAAHKFAELVNEDDGELAEYTGNTSDSELTEKDIGATRTMLKFLEIPKQVYGLPEALEYLKGTWATNLGGLE